MPDDLRETLAGDPDAQTFFEGLTASQRRGYTEWITQAKAPETRQRRLEQTLAALRERRTRR